MPVLDYLLKTRGQRYGLITVGRGFLWLPARIKWEAATSYNPRLTLPPLLSQGQVWVKSDLYLFIYDSQQQAIVYYTRTPPTEQRNPLDEAILEEQFSKMLTKDFPVPNL